jgi:tetratricopeptide (TPR) repeat protein
LKVDVQVRVHPVSVPAYLNLAKLYSGTQRGDQSLDCLVLALKLAPQTVDAYFELGKLRAERGEAAEAAECFRKYVELGGDESRTRPYLKKKTPKI